MNTNYEKTLSQLTENAPETFTMGLLLPIGINGEELGRIGGITQQLSQIAVKCGKEVNDGDEVTMKGDAVIISKQEWVMLQELCCGFVPLMLGRLVGLNNQLRKQESLYIQAQIDSAIGDTLTKEEGK